MSFQNLSEVLLGIPFLLSLSDVLTFAILTSIVLNNAKDRKHVCTFYRTCSVLGSSSMIEYRIIFIAISALFLPSSSISTIVSRLSEFHLLDTYCSRFSLPEFSSAPVVSLFILYFSKLKEPGTSVNIVFCHVYNFKN